MSAPVYLSAYCDASYYYVTGQAGWGAWLRDSKTRVLVAAPIPSSVDWLKGNTQVELFAVYQTVLCALKHLDSETGTHLVVKTDNKGVVGWFKKGMGCGDRETQVVTETLAAVEAAGVTLIVKWVESHQPRNRNVQAYLNTRVDELARRAMIQGERVFWKKPIREAV